MKRNITESLCTNIVLSSIRAQHTLYVEFPQVLLRSMPHLFVAAIMAACYEAHTVPWSCRILCDVKDRWAVTGSFCILIVGLDSERTYYEAVWWVISPSWIFVNLKNVFFYLQKFCKNQDDFINFPNVTLSNNLDIIWFSHYFGWVSNFLMMRMTNSWGWASFHLYLSL